VVSCTAGRENQGDVVVAFAAPVPFDTPDEALLTHPNHYFFPVTERPCRQPGPGVDCDSINLPFAILLETGLASIRAPFLKQTRMRCCNQNPT
jgi:hypothetical protein